MSDENDNGRNSAPGGRQPLTLKPRQGGSVSSGTVKQSFSHGRTKTVVVETKRARQHVPGGGNLAAPSAAERRIFEPQRPAAPAPGAPRSAQPNDGLSAEERAARAAVVERAREQQARADAERRAREDRARAETEAARAAAEPAPAPEPTPAPPPVVAEAPAAAPEPVEPPAPVAAPEPAPAPAQAATPTQAA